MKVQTLVVLLALFAATLSTSQLSAEEIKWVDSYGTAVRQAVAEKREIFLFFEPTQSSKESAEFVETTLKDADLLKELGQRVVLKFSTAQKIEEKAEAKPFSQHKFFMNTQLSSLGGWAVISFVHTEKGALKNSYSFQPATTPKSFKAWETKNVVGVLRGLITQELPVPAVATSNIGTAQPCATAQTSGGGNGELARLNSARAGVRLHALKHDENLYQVAYQRAAEMSRLNSMDHQIHRRRGSNAPNWTQHGARYEGLGNSPEGACYGTWQGDYGITAVGTACVGSYCVNIYR